MHLFEKVSDLSKLCLSRNKIAYYWEYSGRIPKCVLAETKKHPIESFLRQFQLVSWSILNRIFLKKLNDIPKLCLRPNSFASDRNYSKICPKCVLAEIWLHPIENIRRQIEIVSEPNFNCIFSNMFSALLMLRLSQKSIASHRIYSKSYQSCV